MPIALTDDVRFVLVLASDRGKDRPPRFIYRPLTGRESIRFLEDVAAYRAAGAAEALTILFERLVPAGLVDWQDLRDADGTEIPFAAQGLADVLTVDEAVELLELAAAANRPDSDTKKNSASRSP